ncbi:MAG: hypothetical protein QM775_21435 [Pirellulales bacterium]
MSDTRNFVTFDADFIDDAKWTDDGDLVSPGGRAIADALVVALRGEGGIASAVAQQSFYGWTFAVSFDGVEVNCVLQAGDSWLLTSTRKLALIDRLVSSHSPAFKEFLQLLHRILANDQRFSKVLWHSREDYEAGKVDRACQTP